jgi:hypothetical protein
VALATNCFDCLWRLVTLVLPLITSRRDTRFRYASAWQASPWITTLRCEMGSRLTGSEVKVACSKDFNWLLLGSRYVPRLWRIKHALTINMKEEAS